jgi:hypothetical protein
MRRFNVAKDILCDTNNPAERRLPVRLFRSKIFQVGRAIYFLFNYFSQIPPPDPRAASAAFFTIVSAGFSRPTCLPVFVKFCATAYSWLFQTHRQSSS